MDNPLRCLAIFSFPVRKKSRENLTVKVPLSWLRKHLDTRLPIQKLVEILNAIGLVVDSVESTCLDHEDEANRTSDPVLTIAITPNRGDCLSIRGIARDLAAKGVGTLKPIATSSVPEGFEIPFSVVLDFDEESKTSCSIFHGCVIRNVQNSASPVWLQRSLRAIDLRPISALVDITNWIAHDRGQPMHVFNADSIKGKLIQVRLSREGEVFVSLGGNRVTLQEGMTVTCDGNGVISLAGLKGSQRTACTIDTTSVFLESAVFSAIRTAATGRLLGMVSNSGYRFERGVDPSITLDVLNQAAELILKLCGGNSSNVVSVGSVPMNSKAITFDFCCIKKLGGVTIPKQTVKKILTRLGFHIVPCTVGADVVPPPWRHDIDGEASLAMEVLRIDGYGKIKPCRFPRIEEGHECEKFSAQKRLWSVCRVLSARGLVETLSWSFLMKDLAVLFQGGGPELQLLNPLSQEQSTMRPSLLPSLLSLVKRNLSKRIENPALFEIGHQFSTRYHEMQMLAVAGVLSGYWPRYWDSDQRPFDVMDTKSLVEDVLRAYGQTSPRLEMQAPSWYHPKRSVSFYLGPSHDDLVAYCGEVSPIILRTMELEGPIFSFEVLVGLIHPIDLAPGARGPLNSSHFPFVERDFSFLIKKSIPFESLLRVVENSCASLITHVYLLDVYEGIGIPKGMRSITITVRFEAGNRTFESEEISDLTERVVASVYAATGGILR